MKKIKMFLNSYKSALGKQVTFHSIKHDSKKSQIMQNQIYNQLNDIEKKLIKNESSIYAIQQYIEAKGAESNYQAHFQSAMDSCQRINDELLKRCLSIA